MQMLHHIIFLAVVRHRPERPYSLLEAGGETFLASAPQASCL